jgi:hypothetical protein
VKAVAREPRLLVRYLVGPLGHEHEARLQGRLSRQARAARERWRGQKNNPRFLDIGRGLGPGGSEKERQEKNSRTKHDQNLSFV